MLLLLYLLSSICEHLRMVASPVMSIRLCACRHGNKESKCAFDPTGKVNMFTKLQDIDKALREMAEQKPRTRKKEEDMSGTTWTWDEIPQCELYYIFVYDEKGNRLPEHETILPSDKTKWKFCGRISGLEVRVVALFKYESEHSFVDIYRACSKKGNHSDLIIDMSFVSNENRLHPRPSSTHFGFLCSDYKKCTDVERVAARKVSPARSTENVKSQVELAYDAGGQHNVKYLAHTEGQECEEIWVAMELCVKTFDVLVEKKTGDSTDEIDEQRRTYVIDAQRMKTCFRHILQGLIHLHSKKIAHGQVVMENILLTLDGEYLKIGGYDHAKRVETSNFDEDIREAGEMFLKCFKRDSKYETNNATTTILPIGESKFDDSWVSELNALAQHKLNGDGNAFMSAYLIMHMLLDKPTAKEVLLHPFFWSDHKIMFFITRMHVSFGSSQKLMTKIKKAISDKYPNLNWIDELGSIANEFCDEPVRKKLTEEAKNDKTKKGNPKYHSDSIESFLHFIRNKYSHYHDRFGYDDDSGNRKTRPYFTSVSECWKCFSSVLPWMLCLLHRAVWCNRKELPDDLTKFLSESDNADTLSIRTLDGENVMNYYHQKSQ